MKIQRNSRFRPICVVTGIVRSLTSLVVQQASAAHGAAAVTGTAANPNRISDDAAFFAMLDLKRPDLAAVKAAVDAKDWPAAKHAWAAHLAARESPHWLWSRHDSAEIMRIEDE